MEVCNWPRVVVLRGRVVWWRDEEVRKGVGEGVLGKAGEGRFLRRGKGEVLVGRVGREVEGMREGERESWGLAMRPDLGSWI